MGDYKIFTEVTADLTPEMVNEMNIEVIPMEIAFSGTESYMHYPDAREISFAGFYHRLRAGEDITTAQVKYADYINIFEPILEKGEDILYICFSSGLSGTYNTALLAREDLMEKYPNSKILVVDSLAASLGEGLLVYYAAQNRAAGMSIEDNYQWLLEHRLNAAHWFTVDDLYHLKRGGRCSALAAFMGTMLSIKPLLHVDDEGHLVPVEKIRSSKKVVDRMIQLHHDTVILPFDGENEQIIFISHADNEEAAEKLADIMRGKPGVKDVKVGWISPVIGAHCGGGTLALFFMADHR